jgi:hypothetical protein
LSAEAPEVRGLEEFPIHLLISPPARRLPSGNELRRATVQQPLEP